MGPVIGTCDLSDVPHYFNAKLHTRACDGWAPLLTPWQQEIVDRAVEAHKRGERLIVNFPRYGGRSQIARAIERALSK